MALFKLSLPARATVYNCLRPNPNAHRIRGVLKRATPGITPRIYGNIMRTEHTEV